MKKPANPKEQKCPACEGTGCEPVTQPTQQPGRRIYPARCKECDGKGKTTNAN